MEREEAKNYIKHQIGLFHTGNHSIDYCIDTYADSSYRQKDLKFIEIFKKYDSIAVIGDFPLNAVFLAKFLNKKVTIIGKHILLNMFKNIFQENNINIIERNIIFDDLSDVIDDFDLVVHYQNEDTLPFDYLKFKHNKDILVFNSFIYHYRYNNNLALNEDDLMEICNIGTLYEKGRIKFVNNKYCFYVYGKSL